MDINKIQEILPHRYPFLLIDRIISCYNDNDYDYVSNTIEPSFPDGLDAECFNFSSLEKRRHILISCLVRKQPTQMSSSLVFMEGSNQLSNLQILLQGLGGSA